MLRLARRGFSLQGSRACRAESNHERKVCMDLSPPQAANATGGTRTPTGCPTSSSGWRVSQFRHGRRYLAKSSAFLPRVGEQNGAGLMPRCTTSCALTRWGCPSTFPTVPVVLAVVLLLLTACSGAAGSHFPQSTLAPRSDFSADLHDLYKNVFWWAVGVFVIVETLLLIAIARFRARAGAAAPKPIHGHTVLEIGWTLAPALILVFIAVPTMRTIFATSGKAPEGALRVQVIGHQWWWEYRYPELNISAYNELHVPVGTPIAIEMTSADVIHSFWVPRLGGKRDLIQGRTNRIAFKPDSVGEYWGQCAEFCGASHANMRHRTR